MSNSRFLIKDKEENLFLNTVDCYYKILDFEFGKHGDYRNTEDEILSLVESALSLKLLQILDCVDYVPDDMVNNHENSLEHSEELKELLDRDLVVCELKDDQIKEVSKVDLPSMIDDILFRWAKTGVSKKEDEYLCLEFHREFLYDFIKGKTDGKFYYRIVSGDGEEDFVSTEDEYMIFKLSTTSPYFLVDKEMLVSKWRSLLPESVFKY